MIYYFVIINITFFFFFQLKDHSRLQRQVSELKSDLDSAQEMALYCSQKMESYLSEFL